MIKIGEKRKRTAQTHKKKCHVKQNKNTRETNLKWHKIDYQKQANTLQVGYLALSVVIVLTLIVGLLMINYRPLKIKNASMLATLNKNDIVIAERDTSKLRRFDLVQCDFGGDSQVLRVIGFPGEMIQYNEDTLYVDQVPVDEKFIVDEVNQALKTGEPYTEAFGMEIFGEIYTIPAKHYLLLGDNRPHANDSRYYGLIPEDHIKGLVKMRILPLENITYF